jgi:hypothetical protein
VCCEIQKLTDVLHSGDRGISATGAGVGGGGSRGNPQEGLSSVITLNTLQRSCHSPIGSSAHDVLVLVATTLMQKLHTYWRLRKGPWTGEMTKLGVSELLPVLPLKAILLLLHAHNAARRREVPSLGTGSSADGQADDLDDLLTLVLVFPFSEGLCASLLADVGAQLLTLSGSGSCGNAVLFPAGTGAAVAKSIPPLALSVLILATQSPFTEVALYSPSTVLTAGAASVGAAAGESITVDVLPRSLQDMSTAAELLDEFMGALLPALPVVLPPAVLFCIQDEFHRLKPCVYTSALLT